MPHRSSIVFHDKCTFPGQNSIASSFTISLGDALGTVYFHNFINSNITRYTWLGLQFYNVCNCRLFTKEKLLLKSQIPEETSSEGNKVDPVEDNADLDMNCSANGALHQPMFNVQKFSSLC